MKKFDTVEYWENRYLSGRNSGEGSYGENAIYKAKKFNKILNKYFLKSVIEFGCGDGNNLFLYECENYIGFDVSQKAIQICKDRYKNDKSKSFIYYNPKSFKSSDLKADIMISFEVLFHLVEGDLYKKYIKDLFESSSKYVLIFAPNEEKQSDTKHVVFRKFTKDIPDNFELIEKIKTPNRLNLFSDFYLFKKVR